ncbi:hypothetical protein ACVJGD_003873 [Bradyrhizobium sp. USDA 10063]
MTKWYALRGDRKVGHYQALGKKPRHPAATTLR